MIRVTFDDCKYQSARVLTFDDEHAYRNFIENSTAPCSIKNSIIKIEKQVKDLTLEECRKLIAEVSIDIFGNIVGIRYQNRIYNFDDYIDITNLMKE